MSSDSQLSNPPRWDWPFSRRARGRLRRHFFLAKGIKALQHPHYLR